MMGKFELFNISLPISTFVPSTTIYKSQSNQLYHKKEIGREIDKTKNLIWQWGGLEDLKICRRPKSLQLWYHIYQIHKPNHKGGEDRKMGLMTLDWVVCLLFNSKTINSFLSPSKTNKQQNLMIPPKILTRMAFTFGSIHY